MRDVRVATVQYQHVPGGKASNLDRVRHFAAEAARSGVEIVAFRTGNAMVLDLYGGAVTETRAAGGTTVVADLDASLLQTSSGRRWLRARRPELYESLARPTGQEMETRRVRSGG